jgi:chromosome segregation ATPase
VIDQSPEHLQSIGESWYAQIQENIKKVIAMTPEEHAEYRAKQDQEALVRSVTSQYERAKRRLAEAKENYDRGHKAFEELSNEV